MGFDILKIKKDDAVLVAIDFQEKIIAAMYEKEVLADKITRLVKGAKVLDLPVIVTQQYTKGLGDTIAPVKEALGDFVPVEKNTFSCLDNEEFKAKLEKTGRKTVVLCGIEAHICVMQTALDLLKDGYRVFIVNDCCSSRDRMDHKFANKRMQQSGCTLTTYEAVLYEIMGGSRAPEFKEISAIVK